MTPPPKITSKAPSKPQVEACFFTLEELLKAVIKDRHDAIKEALMNCTTAYLGRNPTDAEIDKHARREMVDEITANYYWDDTLILTAKADLTSHELTSPFLKTTP